MTTMTTSRSACPDCGILDKSGKASCCGRGGSWFRNCGSAGNTKFRYTWYEGVLSCKTRPQLKEISSWQSNTAQKPKSSHGINIVNATATENFVFTPANISAPIPAVNALTTTPDNESSTAFVFTSMTNGLVGPLTTIPDYSSNLTTANTAVYMTMITDGAKKTTAVAEWMSQGMCHVICVIIVLWNTHRIPVYL